MRHATGACAKREVSLVEVLERQMEWLGMATAEVTLVRYPSCTLKLINPSRVDALCVVIECILSVPVD